MPPHIKEQQMGTWDNHCPNCFTEKPAGNRQCQHCGYDEKTSRSPAALPVRTILHDQFVVGRVLGNPGGFGITYLCWDIQLATRVAIKEFMPRDNAVRDRDGCSVVAHSGKDQEFFEYGLKAFLAEARTVAGLNHPNIVRIRTYFEQNHTAYLVMDYYTGVSLAEYVKQKGGRLPEKAAMGILGFVLDGLRHVHDAGYLHRDIKPANIYLTGKGQVILLDFGAARYAIGEHTRSLSVVVTPGFSPFEQYSTKGAQGPWTDIYAVGATLYFMLTGKPPDSAPDRMISDTLTETVRQAPGLSPGVKQWIIRSMQVKASDRPHSVTEFGAGLRKCQSDTTQPKPVTQNRQPVPRQENVSKKEDEISQPANAIRYNPKREQKVPEKEDIPTDKDKSGGKYKPVAWRKKGWIALNVGLLIVVSYLLNLEIQEKEELKKKDMSVVLERPADSVVGTNPTDVKKATWTDPMTGMEFVWIPGGSFDMGSPDGEEGREENEGPVHRVEVDGFWIGKTEVTVEQFRQFVEKTGYRTDAENDGWSPVLNYSSEKFEAIDGVSWQNPGFDQERNHPVVHVSWNDAQEMVKWLNNWGNGFFLLPSEAQWEYACRGGTKTSRYWGDSPDKTCEYANVDEGSYRCIDGYTYTSPVGSYQPNAFGLYDTLGNVWELCEDVYQKDIYSKSANSKNPIYTSGGDYRVTRGGSWYGDPARVRCAFRCSYLGFRLLRIP